MPQRFQWFRTNTEGKRSKPGSRCATMAPGFFRIFQNSKQEIVENGYDLSINKYKKTEYKPVEYAPTTQILAELQELEAEIAKGLAELEGML